MKSAMIVGVMALVTMLLRFLPFLVFKRNVPPYVTYLGGVLPAAIIGMLVIYCLKDVQPAAPPHGLPEAIAILAVVALHLWKRQMLLSIAGGTVCYMLLVQMVF